MLSIGFAQTVWELRNPLSQGISLDAVAYGNNQFITVGENGTILTSPDGVKWTERYSGKIYEFLSVTYQSSTNVINLPPIPIFSNSGRTATYAMTAGMTLGLGSCMLGGVHPFVQHGRRAKKFIESPNIKCKSKEGIFVILGYSKVKYIKGINRTFTSITTID